MYGQNYIDTIGEQTLYDMLDGKKSYRLDINNLYSKNQQFYYCFQHFIVKAYVNGHNRAACRECLKKLYNDFYNNPHLFCDSPLVSDKALNAIFGDDPVKNRIKECRNNYYNKSSINALYQKKKTTELTEEEKNRYYSYLIVLLNKNSDNKKYKEVFESEISRIIKTNIKNLSDIELKFYAQYVSNFAKGNANIKTTVMIGTDPGAIRGYELNNYIFINKDKFDSIELLTKTVCHETRHAVQEYETKGKDSLPGFEMAQQKLFCKYLNTDAYDSYHSNYKYSTIELDAEFHGHWNAGVFFTMFKQGEMAEKIRENRRNTYDNRNNYSFMVNEEKKALSVDEFIVTNFDKIISNNPSELDNYIVLKNMYNDDGTKKSFKSMVESRMEETALNRGLFDNYINYGIATGELNNVSLDGFDQNKMKEFTQTFSHIYRKYVIEIKDYLKDKDNSINPKQMVFATNYKITLAGKLLTYIEENYDKIVDGMNEPNFNNQHPIFSFLSDLRDFNVDDIDNEVLKNSKETIELFDKLKKVSNNLLTKFNQTYINNRIDKLPLEIRKSDITLSGGTKVNFEGYFKKYILSQMNSHQEVTFGSHKYYVGDLIRGLSKHVQENTLSNESQHTR